MAVVGWVDNETMSIWNRLGPGTFYSSCTWMNVSWGNRPQRKCKRQTITTFMCSQQFWTIREKRATNQLLVLRLQKQGRSRPWSLLTALGVLRRADHLRFLPALTINPHLPAPPVKGPHHPLSWQEQGHRFLFSLTFNAAGIPIKPSLNFFSALVNYFCWLKNPRIQVGNKEV